MCACKESTQSFLMLVIFFLVDASNGFRHVRCRRLLSLPTKTDCVDIPPGLNLPRLAKRRRVSGSCPDPDKSLAGCGDFENSGSSTAHTSPCIQTRRLATARNAAGCFQKARKRSSRLVRFFPARQERGFPAVPVGHSLLDELLSTANWARSALPKRQGRPTKKFIASHPLPSQTH